MKSVTQNIKVRKEHSAAELGSGLLDVFATPAMVALMENTATKAMDDLEEGITTVGIEINVKHLKASKIGETVMCEATLTSKNGRIYKFEITVSDSSGDIIGTATHKRAAVDSEKFMKKVNG